MTVSDGYFYAAGGVVCGQGEFTCSFLVVVFALFPESILIDTPLPFLSRRTEWDDAISY